MIYDVVEISHDASSGVSDTSYYQLKTYWADTFVDNEGRVAREFHRFVRDSINHPWQLKDAWTGIIDGIRGELVEENQRKVKLVFSPTLQKYWNANAYNTSDALDCYYRDIHRDTTINGVLFDSTLVVEQAMSYSFIDTVRKYEMYAKDVGLIYKHFREISYQPIGQISLIDQGKELYMTYVSHGFE